MDSWFASKENFEFIVRKGKDFIAAVKSNRLFAVSLEDKLNGRFERVGALGLKDKESVRGYIRGYDKEVILTCQVFTSKDGSTGRLYLVSSDTTLSDVYILRSIKDDGKWRSITSLLRRMLRWRSCLLRGRQHR